MSSPIIDLLRPLYGRTIRPLLGSHLNQQRVKLLFLYGWEYFAVFKVRRLSLFEKIRLIYRFYRIDFFILNSHSAKEMAHILIQFFEKKSTEGDVFVEAGCWKGGSTAKFSLLCAINNYKLHVFDSFEGVEQTDDELSFFGGWYAAPERLVRENVEKYGCIEVVTFHKGWFKDTFRDPEIHGKIGAVYIDCDLKTGTMEVLDGIKNNLAEDALIFSQDYHIPPIRKLLNDSLYWEGLGLRVRKSQLTKKLALFRIVE